MNIEILCYFCFFFLFLFHSLRKLKCTRCLVSEKIGEVRKLWHFYVFLVSWQYTIASIKLNGCISELRILFCISDTFQQFYWKILRISLVSNYIGNQISGIILSHYMFFLFIFSNSLADNLKDLLRFLRRDDPQSRSVFKQVCKWNTVSKDLIPIIEHCQDDRNLVLNAGKGLFILHYMFFFFFQSDYTSLHVNSRSAYNGFYLLIVLFILQWRFWCFLQCLLRLHPMIFHNR